MTESDLIRHGAPTLAGLKTGNLFTCPCTSKEQVTAEIRRLNQILVPRGLRLLPMRYKKDHVLVYLFRPARLEQDLAQKDAVCLLRESGYCSCKQFQCISELIPPPESPGGVSA